MALAAATGTPSGPEKGSGIGFKASKPGRTDVKSNEDSTGSADSTDALGPSSAVFVAIAPSSADSFDALDAAALENGLERAAAQYPNMLAPDLMAVTLRKLGIKCKAIELNPAEAGPGGPDPRSFPGFRAVLIQFPGARRTWLTP